VARIPAAISERAAILPFDIYFSFLVWPLSADLPAHLKHFNTPNLLKTPHFRRFPHGLSPDRGLAFRIFDT
jgi:hypothetical protein